MQYWRARRTRGTVPVFYFPHGIVSGAIKKTVGSGHPIIASYCFGPQMYEVVTPAKAGVQEVNQGRYWIPAFAGMTAVSYFIGPNQ